MIEIEICTFRRLEQADVLVVRGAIADIQDHIASALGETNVPLVRLNFHAGLHTEASQTQDRWHSRVQSSITVIAAGTVSALIDISLPHSIVPDPELWLRHFDRAFIANDRLLEVLSSSRDFSAKSPFSLSLHWNRANGEDTDSLQSSRRHLYITIDKPVNMTSPHQKTETRKENRGSKKAQAIEKDLAPTHTTTVLDSTNDSFVGITTECSSGPIEDDKAVASDSTIDAANMIAPVGASHTSNLLRHTLNTWQHADLSCMQARSPIGIDLSPFYHLKGSMDVAFAVKELDLTPEKLLSSLSTTPITGVCCPKPRRRQAWSMSEQILIARGQFKYDEDGRIVVYNHSTMA